MHVCRYTTRMWYNRFLLGGLYIRFVRRPHHTAIMTCSQLVWVPRPQQCQWVCVAYFQANSIWLSFSLECVSVCVYEQTKRHTHLSKHCVKAGTVLIIRTHTHNWRTSCTDSGMRGRDTKSTNTNEVNTQIAQRNVTSFAQQSTKGKILLILLIRHYMRFV